MKKILFGLFTLSLTAMAAEGTHVYLKAGLDPYGKFKETKVESVKLNSKKQKGLGYEFSVEATQSLMPQVEVGFGVEYQDHGKAKRINDKALKGVALPKFRSIPLYLTAKYDIPLDSEFHPYLKADLGYSFNMKESKTHSLDRDTHVKLSYKNGMYWGIGAGVEYQNFVADLMYKMNYGKVKVDFNDTIGAKKWTSKTDYGRVTLSVGYRFDF